AQLAALEVPAQVGGQYQALAVGGAAVAALGLPQPHPAVAVEVELRPTQLGHAPGAAVAEPAREAADGDVLVAEVAAAQPPVLAGLAVAAIRAEHRVAAHPVQAHRQ